METSAKISCQILVDLLVANNITNVVLSPGSRNAPLVIAMSRCEALNKYIVIDERSAAFVALGMAIESGAPTVLVCTSGTAVLNYSPAIAEAYYRRVPLIVVSADRPAEWIDQDDSQTLRQFEALANYVKRSYNIPDNIYNETSIWYVNRIINDAIINATSGRFAPVHINMQFDEPLNGIVDNMVTRRVVTNVECYSQLSKTDAQQLATKISQSDKVLIIAGFNNPDKKLNSALSKLAQFDNVVIMTESIANLKDKRFISTIDRVLCAMSPEEKKEAQPDIVITLGGALVSRHIKQYLRDISPVEHWHIGVTENTIDCFKCLSKRININADGFFSQISKLVQPNARSSYAKLWSDINMRASSRHDNYVKSVEWSDIKAFDIIFSNIPKKWNIHLSNGTSIRYAQLFDTTIFRRSECNRGVSGIDGSTSTAIGASVACPVTTLLITGDMSAQYDIGALALKQVSPRFKMIVINNGGGGIFRFIKSTSQLPELDEYFACQTNLALAQLAEGFGFDYYNASNENELKRNLKLFVNKNDKPAILCINTPANESATILKNYFTQK
jgi:2-succinyl-5-enolpyruvyl-6-hydroxy-3-cyclohexene-1-carboxylate synthase